MLKDPVHINDTLAHTLMIGSGIFWTFTYLLILRRGYLDKAYGMPMLALCANLSWEFIFSFIFPHPQPQLFIDYLWLLFDVGIMIQYLQYGRKEFSSALSPKLFHPIFFLSLLISAFTIIMICHEFDEYIGIYPAFVQNLLMSVLFIHLLLKRNFVLGQSLWIALFKLVGTMLASYLFSLYYPKSPLLLYLFLIIFLFDLIYFLLLYIKLKSAGVSPWARW